MKTGPNSWDPVPNENGYFSTPNSEMRGYYEHRDGGTLRYNYLIDDDDVLACGKFLNLPHVVKAFVPNDRIEQIAIQLVASDREFKRWTVLGQSWHDDGRGERYNLLFEDETDAVYASMFI